MNSLKYLISLFLHFLLCLACFAQKEKVESLTKILPSFRDTARIDCLNELSYSYLQMLKKDSAEYYAKAGLEEANKINYINGIALSILRKSEITIRLEGDFIKSETLAKESLKWYERTANKKGLDGLYFLLWLTMFSQSRYDEAITYAEKRYQLFKEAGNKMGIWDALHMIAIVYKEAGKYEESFHYNRQAYEVALNDYKTVLPISHFVFGELYSKIGDYPTALSHFRQAFLLDNLQSKTMRLSSGWDIWVKMEFAEVFSLMHEFDSAWHYYHLFKPSKENEVHNRIYLVSTGECYFLQKNYKNALQNFLEGLAGHKKLNDQNQIMRTLLDVAKTYIELGNDSAALQYGWEGLVIALNNKARQFIRDGYQILYSVYDRRLKTDSANFYFRQFIDMRDSVANDQTKAKFAAYGYEQKIELLNKEKQIKEERLKQTTLQKKFLIAVITALVLVGIVLFRNLILKRKNEKLRLVHELELQQIESEKTKVEFQQQTTVLEMQALRAQMNPHFIFNSLNSINRFILQNNKAEASEYLTKFSRLVRLILQNSQSALIPLESELESLQLYLELEAVRFDHHFDFNIKVDDELETDIIKVPPLIIQPYAENAIWHGLMHKDERGNLEIELFQQGDVLCCKITDDGVGRKKAVEIKSKSASTHKSMGMQITASRIEMLQQKKHLNTFITITDLVLHDGSAGGTEVLLKIPVCYD